MSYIPPRGDTANLGFGGAYEPPRGTTAALVFEAGAPRTITTDGIAPGGVGTPAIGSMSPVGVAGIAPGVAPAPRASNYRQYVTTSLPPDGDVPVGGVVANWRQFVYAAGWQSTSFGVAYTPRYTLEPGGWDAGVVPAPRVSPAIIYTQGAAFTAFGYPTVQPQPHPAGWDSAAIGAPAVADSTQRTYPGGVPPGVCAQPAAGQLRQEVFATPPVEAGLFGDVQVRLTRRYLQVPGTQDEFVSPFAAAVNRNVHVTFYTPIGGSFGASGVRNASPNLTPVSLGPEVFGTPDAGGRVKTAQPPGAPAGEVSPYGAVRNVAQGAAGAGIPPGGIPAPDITHGVRGLLLPGVAAPGFGDSTVWWGRRTLVTRGSDAAEYGTAVVESSIRALEVPGIAPALPAAPRVSPWTQEVQPEGAGTQYPWQQFGAGAVGDALIRAYPPGVSDGGLGTPRAARNERVVAPPGLVGSPGEPTVQLLRRVLAVRSLEDQSAWGGAQARLSRRYVAPALDEVAAQRDRGVGAPLAENRNRQVGAFSVLAPRVLGGAEVANTARLLSPGGARGVVGDAAITFRVRAVAPAGTGSSSTGTWGVVHNRRQIVEPSGVPRPYAGVPTVLDTTQRVGPVGGTDTALAGVALVAPRVRTVAIDRQGIGQGRFPDPDAQLYTRRVATAGTAGGCGVPTVEPHRNVLAPKGPDYSQYGAAAVRNRTPELQMGAWDSAEVGRPAAVLNTRYVSVPGAAAGGLAPPVIGYRTRLARPGGVETLRHGLTAVLFDAPQLPAQQTVSVGSIQAPGAQVPVPDLLYRGVLLAGWDSGRLGAPAVRSNCISGVTVPLDEVDQMGVPSLNPAQYTYPGGLAPPDVEWPRLTPTTLWIHEPPPPWQAKPNSLMDEVIASGYPSFGSTAVTHYARGVAQAHDGNATTIGERVGEPIVALRQRRLVLLGVTPGRFGFPKLPTGNLVRPYWGRLTEEWVPGEDFDTAEYGAPHVAPPSSTTQQLSMAGDDLLQVGLLDAELQVRTIAPLGVYATIFTGDTAVHPPVVLYPQGVFSGSSGGAWASLAVRTVLATGLDALQLDYALGTGVSAALRVRHRWVALPSGVKPGVPGAPAVILPDLGAVATLGDTSSFGRPRLGACAC